MLSAVSYDFSSRTGFSINPSTYLLEFYLVLRMDDPSLAAASVPTLSRLGV